MNYEVIVIGAGASGLVAAIAAARAGSSVLVIEQKEKAGKKILATGNGKCNFTNMIQKPECYRSDDSAFAMKVLSCFDVNKTIEFFGELGIYPKNRGGYLYPNSEQALSVVQVLLMECERLKVAIHYNEKVTDIRKPDYSVVTELSREASEIKSGNRSKENNRTKNNRNENNRPESNKADRKKATDPSLSEAYGKTPADSEKEERIYSCRKLIIAAGGCASPQLGSDGSGYALAKRFGHTVIKPLPALVQLKSPVKFLKTISGVRTNARVTLYAGQQQEAVEEGEILFTDYGISGIPVMQVSRYAAKALDMGEKVQLKLDFLPEISRTELIELLNRRMQKKQGNTLEEMMIGLLNHKLSYILMQEAGLDVYRNVKQVTKQEISKLAEYMKEFTLPVSQTNSFENAQVCAGGVSTEEIEETTMESKLYRNLYFTGELLDVDGTCGGYNLQWAWSTGYLAGSAAGKRIGVL